ncbi:MAG: sulfatase [Verrucomicrobiota bacterium]
MRPGTTRLALAIIAGCVSVAEAKNAVFIIVDDLRPKLGCYGDAVAISPSIDKLAKGSTLFSRAYCQYPVCNPSRSSFLSGMRPDSTGVYGNEKQALSPAALKDVLVMNRHFANSGFEVAGFGKVYHDGPGPEGGWTRPFLASKWLDYVRPENNAIGDNYFSPKRPKDQKMPSSWEAEDVPDDAYCDGIVAREAVKSLKELAGQKKPFLMLVGFRHPHMPWCAPKKYWDLYDREALPTATNRNFPEGAPEVALNRFGELWSYANTPEGPLTEALQKQSVHAYYACMSYVDAQVGKVVAALKELNLYEDTVIVLISDNGYQMGDNGTWCKEVNWEATNRIVCMLRAPGHGQPGQVVDKLVELVDVYPTLCAASGVPIPKHCEGKSLLPLVDDPKAPWTDIAFSQFRRGDVMGRSIRTDRYRFTLWEREGGALVGRELYDLKVDPQGNVNLAEHADERARVLELTKLLQEKWPESHKVSRSTRSQEVSKASKSDPPLE